MFLVEERSLGEGAEHEPWNRGNPMVGLEWERQAGSLQANQFGI